MINNIFIELALMLVIAVLIAGLVRLFKQPLIIGYILAGIIVSPYMLDLGVSSESVQTIAEMSVALLLFLVGLNLNPKSIKDVGKASVITAVGQVIFFSIVGFIICRMLGFSPVASLYIALALSNSSTIIIMKLLSDKGDTESLYGRISLGFLLVQDFITILILMGISATTQGTGLSNLIIESVLRGIGLLIILLLIGVYVLPKIVNIIAKSQEFLLLFSISWCLFISAIFLISKFSIEIGALVAGILLSFSPYRFEISSKLRPLRDFFLVIFFILLGSQFVFSQIHELIIPVIVLSLFILLGIPLVVMIIMGVMGYTKRNSFLVGITVAQISEFSFILVALGVKMNHVSQEILSLVTIIGLVTVSVSTYLIIYANQIYVKLSPYLNLFERKGKKVDVHKYTKHDVYDIFLFGYNRIGYDLLNTFKKTRKKFMVVDYNPETIKKLAEQKIHCRYGDVSDTELLDELDLHKAKMVVSTIRDLQTDLLLIKKIRENNKKAIIICVAQQIDEALMLYDEGASYVILPHMLGGKHTATMIENYSFSMNKFLKEKISHIKHLEARRSMEHAEKYNQ